MTKEKEFYQIYHIHLLGGDVIDIAEPYDLPAEKGLVGDFEKANDAKIFTVGDPVFGLAYIPKRSILYISTGGVKEV